MEKPFTETEEKVFSYIEENRMIEPGDRILLGVSGGADSVCLFRMCLAYRRRIPFEFVVVHVNHGIRTDATEDASYVEQLCTEQKIPFFLIEEDVKALAKREKCSEEDAGRRVRYRAFETIGAMQGVNKIAVAHNANDCAETMLLHLFRGSGLRGLAGIAPVRDRIIRPLLCLSRQEIEAYLLGKGLSWKTDSTNATDDYARNRVRHHVLDYAAEHINARSVEHMCSTAEQVRETLEYLEIATEQAARECMRDNSILVEPFLRLPSILQKRLLLGLCESLSPTGKDIGQVHIHALLSLFEKNENREIILPFGIRFCRSYDRVLASMGHEQEEKGEEIVLSMREFPTPADLTEIPQNQYTKWFDCDKITEPIEFRRRKTGDYLTFSDGKGGMRHKTLKEYMIAEKIPRNLRDQIPVVADGSHVLWLVGYRISEFYKVDQNTKKILEIRADHIPGEYRTEEK